MKSNIFSIKNDKICVVSKVKSIETSSSICHDLKGKNCEIFLISIEEQLVNCVCHTHSFLQTYFLFKLLIKLFYAAFTPIYILTVFILIYY